MSVTDSDYEALAFECARLLVENRSLRTCIARLQGGQREMVMMLEEYIPETSKHPQHEIDRLRVGQLKDDERKVDAIVCRTKIAQVEP